MPNNKHNKHFGGLKLILLLFSTLFPFGHLLSQSVSTPVSSDTVKSELDKLFGADQRLVSGDFYNGAPLGSITGHPYFFDETWKNGNVTIGNIEYDNLLLKFDIAANIVAMRTKTKDNKSIQICLKKENISRFTMGEAKFIRFPNENNTNKIIFAQLCSEGRVNFLLVKSKVLVVSNGDGSDYKYKEYYQNYLLYNEQIIKFKSRKTLYDLFPEYKPALKKYWSQNSFSTGRTNTNSLTILVNYCNTLLNSAK